MKYIKPETEAKIDMIGFFIWPVSLIMGLFGLLFREKKPRFYADPVVEKQRSKKAKAKSRRTPVAAKTTAYVEPWELPPEKMPWE